MYMYDIGHAKCGGGVVVGGMTVKDVRVAGVVLTCVFVCICSSVCARTVTFGPGVHRDFLKKSHE